MGWRQALCALTASEKTWEYVPIAPRFSRDEFLIYEALHCCFSDSVFFSLQVTAQSGEQCLGPLWESTGSTSQMVMVNPLASY